MFRSVLVVLAVTAAVLVVAMTAGRAVAQVKEADVQKITEAMPTEATAKPAKARKVLVYSHCNGFRHGSIPWGDKAFEIMGKKTGAFEAVVSNDLANFEADKLKEFDAVILNNCTGLLFGSSKPRKPGAPNPKRIKDPAKLKQAQEKYQKDLARYEEMMKKAKGQPDRGAELRKNLLDWVQAGGAIVGTHAATDTRGCDDYNKMIGGQFSGHPWNMLVPVKNDDPGNPINAAFDGKGFSVADEIYQFNKGFYDRTKQRVLLSLDMSKLTKKGGRADNDYAISWVKTFGKGRVFYCSLGHRNEIFWNPAVLKHYLAGIQWALGDLKGVDTTPNPIK